MKFASQVRVILLRAQIVVLLMKCKSHLFGFLQAPLKISVAAICDRRTDKSRKAPIGERVISGI